MDTFYMRNPGVVMMARGSACFFLRPGNAPVAISPADVDALSRLMQAASTPIAAGRLDAMVDAATKALLLEENILLSAPEPVLRRLLPSPPGDPKPCKHLVLGLTGGIASVQTVPRVLELLATFADQVDVILTDGAMRLVNADVFQFLGVRVWTDAFTTRDGLNTPHVQLAQAAEMIVVMPASAHTLHKISQGACSDLLSLTIAATESPVVLIPAMNRAMWSNPAISRNLKQLRADGYYVVEPAIGREVSQRAGDPPEFGGAGLGGFDLVQLLAEILKLHRSRLAQPT